MLTITITRESDNRTVEASVEAWVLGLISILSQPLRAELAARVVKIDREGVRTGELPPSDFASPFSAQGRKPQ